MATAAPSRPRPGGGRLFIIVGLILALVTAGGVYLLVTVLGGGTGIGGGPTSTVVFAKQAIPIRHQITAADLDTEKVSDNAALNTYARPSDITQAGLIAELQISKGAVITSDMLAKDINLVPSGSSPAYLPLAKGFVAMTIPTGEQQGIAFFPTKGDYLTVIASGTVTLFSTGGVQAPGPPRVVSKTVFTNVRIIGLGPATPNVQPASGATTVGGTAQNGGATTSLTIEVTQCQAEYFTWFLNNMQLKYTLESFKDYAIAPTDPDPTCPAITDAHGISNITVDGFYHFSSL